jgi:hypothetical protein
MDTRLLKLGLKAPFLEGRVVVKRWRFGVRRRLGVPVLRSFVCTCSSLALLGVAWIVPASASSPSDAQLSSAQKLPSGLAVPKSSQDLCAGLQVSDVLSRAGLSVTSPKTWDGSDPGRAGSPSLAHSCDWSLDQLPAGLTIWSDENPDVSDELDFLRLGAHCRSFKLSGYRAQGCEADTSGYRVYRLAVVLSDGIVGGVMGIKKSFGVQPKTLLTLVLTRALQFTAHPVPPTSVVYGTD